MKRNQNQAPGARALVTAAARIIFLSFAHTHTHHSQHHSQHPTVNPSFAHASYTLLYRHSAIMYIILFTYLWICFSFPPFFSLILTLYKVSIENWEFNLITDSLCVCFLVLRLLSAAHAKEFKERQDEHEIVRKPSRKSYRFQTRSRVLDIEQACANKRQIKPDFTCTPTHMTTQHDKMECAVSPTYLCDYKCVYQTLLNQRQQKGGASP